MEGFLIALLFVFAFVNLGLTIFLLKKEKENRPSIDPEILHHNMEEFVVKMEKENNELYERMINYIKEKETILEKRISSAEKKLSSEDAIINLEEHNVNHLAENSGEQKEKDTIIQLHKQGFSTKQIAKIMQKEISEVELYVKMITVKQGKLK